MKVRMTKKCHNLIPKTTTRYSEEEKQITTWQQEYNLSKATSPLFDSVMIAKLEFHAQIQKVALDGVPNLTSFFWIFLVDEGRDDPNTTISGPPLARQRNAI